MFGLGGRFTYAECPRCGCLRLLNVPVDMAPYYPEQYGAYDVHGALKARILAQWAKYAYGRPNPVGFMLDQVYGPYLDMASIRDAPLRRNDRILDVGCGSGRLIRDMKELGFLHVSGIDAHVPATIVHFNGVRVERLRFEQVDGRYDVLMMHHSFEHMPDPKATLHRARRLLRDGGLLLMRIPIASSWAWRHYGVFWMHLDAPRHLFVHTCDSIDVLARATGFTIEGIRWEGNESQFLGSEQYRQGIPLYDMRSYTARRRPSYREWKRRREFRRRADALNRNQEGDWACFHLRALGSAPSKVDPDKAMSVATGPEAVAGERWPESF